jgi:hypothetical protein
MNNIISGKLFNFLFRDKIFIKFLNAKYFTFLENFDNYCDEFFLDVLCVIEVSDNSFISYINEDTYKIKSGETNYKNCIIFDNDFKMDDWLISRNILDEYEIRDLIVSFLKKSLASYDYFSDKYICCEKSEDFFFDIFVEQYQKTEKFPKLPIKLQTENFLFKIIEKYPSYITTIKKSLLNINFCANIVNINPELIFCIPNFISGDIVFEKKIKQLKKWNDKTHHLIKHKSFRRIVFITFMCLNKKYGDNMSIYLNIFSLLFDYYFM